jgi:hypothetical protein
MQNWDNWSNGKRMPVFLGITGAIVAAMSFLTPQHFVAAAIALGGAGFFLSLILIIFKR